MTTTQIAAPALSFVLIYAEDVNATHRYFTEQLGLAYVADQSGPDFRQYGSGEGGIGLGVIRPTAGDPQPGTVQLYFYTQDMERLRETLVARGVDAGPIQHPPFGDIFDVPSPHGEPPLTMMQPR